MSQQQPVRTVPPTFSPWLDAIAAVAYLGLPTTKALYQAVRRGQVPVHRLGSRRMRFHRAELDQVLLNRR